MPIELFYSFNNEANKTLGYKLYEELFYAKNSGFK